MVLWKEEIEHYLNRKQDDELKGIYEDIKSVKWRAKKTITASDLHNAYQRYLWNMRDSLIWNWAEDIFNRFEHRPQLLWCCRAALGEAHWQECHEYLHNLLSSEYGHLFCTDYEGTLDEETESDEDIEHEILWTLAHALATLRWVRLEHRGKVEKAVPDEAAIAAWLETYLTPIPDPDIPIQLSLF